MLRGGNDDGAHAAGHLSTLEDGRRRGHVGQASVGAAADDHLVDLHVQRRSLVDGLCVFGQMGEGDCRPDGRKVDVDYLLVWRVCVGSIHGICVLRPAVHVGAGHVVHLENAVFCSGLDGHVRHAQAVVDGKAGQPRPAELHAFIKRAVHADPADDVQDHILAAGMAL